METLTSRELDVLRLLAKHGGGNKTIARELGIEPATVKARLREALRKIGLRTRTQAALWYRDHGPGWQRIGDIAGEIVRELGRPAMTSDDRALYRDADGAAAFHDRGHLPSHQRDEGAERKGDERGEDGDAERCEIAAAMMRTEYPPIPFAHLRIDRARDRA
jgi:DNA-binding CsgD family transcriptional regulator